jgi:glycosyltransferase involved in cell wall biosynthesis
VRIATLSNAAVIHTHRWVDYFRSRGHEVGVWSLEPGPAALGAHALPRLPLPGFARYPLAAWPLRRALAAFAPDLVDAHYVPNYGMIGALAGVRPLVVSAWGSDLLIAAARNPLQTARARFVLRRADAVLADSLNLAAAALALGAPRDRTRAIPWGVDLERFRFRGAREPGLLLSTRAHEMVYDIETILRGVKPVLERRPGTRLAIAGRGSRTSSLRRLAAGLLPAGRYCFLGSLAHPELAEWLARAEVYLSASLSDSTSLSLLEAMASGAVPAVSDLDGNREWVAEGDGARLFRSGDADGLTRAIERVLDDPSWAEQARSRNRRTVEERADRTVNMMRIEELFAALARRPDGSRAPAGPRGARR